MINKTFGESLKKLRLNSGFKSARQLAVKSGLSNATISRLENNTQKPELETLKIISQHLINTTYEDLLKLAGYINNPEGNNYSLSLKEQELIIKSRRLNDNQIDLVLKLIDEMF